MFKAPSTYLGVSHRRFRPTAHETLLLCVVVGTEVGVSLVRLSPFPSWTRGSGSTSDCCHEPSWLGSTLLRILVYGAPRRRRNGGGDCLVDLAPMAYLNTRYGGTLGVLWVDAHPDVLTPKDFAQGNAQVLGALLGKGDSDLVSEVNTPIKTSHIKFAGLDAWTPVEGAVINTFGLRRAGSDSLAETSAPVLNWIADEGIAHLAIHFDVDVLDPAKFGPVLFNRPVYMPWEAIAMHNMLRKLPLLAG